ncbi:MAG: sigma-70 family RNA polymerase sigma factor [Planctomycetes bacterium]|nr:sigma-70 family RNA polymerase sigma factor [Planctomycetota bacterium]
MVPASLNGTLRKVFEGVRDAVDHGDGELLARYRSVRDQDAFGSLVRRHGPMVLGVCRRVLRDSHAADDAFQTTFLVLAKRADAVRPPDRLAPWLYGVAYRTALKARGRAFRRQQVEQDYATETATRALPTSPEASDLLPALDEQLNALPEKYRTPLVLCGVQGLNKTEAAERLGLPEGTVSSRLARAREMLRDRLIRRGVAVPSAAFAALFTADTLQAAVPASLATSTTGIALGSSPIPATVLTLSHEVIRSMTMLKLQFWGTIAMAVSLVGGSFGLLAIQADEKKPQPVPGEIRKPQPAQVDPVKKPNGNDEKNGQNNQKDGDKPGKPAKPAVKAGGRVGAVDAKENTITLVTKGEGGLVEKAMKVPAGAKVFIDDKEAKLADIPKGSFASFLAGAPKDGKPDEITEVRVTGGNTNGIIKQVGATSLSLESEKNPQTFKLTADTKVTVNGKDAKIADLKVGDKVAVLLSADGASALSLASGNQPDGVKPIKTARFTGKVTAVDAAAKTISLAGKGEGNDIVVKLTADAKITVDGKAAKFSDIVKGGQASFILVPTRDGQPREASEVAVAGITFGGAVKQIDATSVTVGTEKADRVVKLVADAKVVVNGKEAKLADLKVGDRVQVTLASDESGAVLIVVGVKKPEGDKPKPEGDKPKPEKTKPEEK